MTNSLIRDGQSQETRRTNGHAPTLAGALPPPLPEPEPTLVSGPEAAAPTEQPVDLRTAGIDDLRRLPGVGPVMAQRILDYRASVGGFTKPEDLMAVPGIGKSVYQNLAGRVTVSAPEVPPAPPEPAPAMPIEAAASPAAPAPAPEPQPVAPPPERPPQPAPAPYAAARAYAVPVKPQRDLVGLLLSSLAGALMGALITLVTLALINRGTLNLNEKADVAGLTERVNALATDVSGVRTQADDLASRLDALSGLPGRVAAAESAIEQTAADLRTTASRVTALDQRTTQLASQVETILGAVGRFNRFLDGLRDLLLETQLAPAAPPQATEGPAPTQTAAPTRAPTPTRAPSRTPAPSATPAG